jgi:hypothetical protein
LRPVPGERAEQLHEGIAGYLESPFFDDQAINADNVPPLKLFKCAIREGSVLVQPRRQPSPLFAAEEEIQLSF